MEQQALASTLRDSAAQPQTCTRKVGGFSFTSLYDGYIDIAASAFIGSKDTLPWPSAANASGTWRTDIACFLVEFGAQKMLFDTGMGTLGGPTMGKLIGSLALLNLRPSDITDVVLTHLHRDHCGGLSDPVEGGAFESSLIHVHAKEVEYWTDKAAREAAPENTRRFFDAAQRAVDAAGSRLRLFDNRTKLAEGIEVVALHGHTPGHCGFHVMGGDESILIWGDVVHNEALQFANPEIAVLFDSDAAAAVKTRRAVVEMAIQEQLWVAGAHLPFPSVGKACSATASSYRYAPA